MRVNGKAGASDGGPYKGGACGGHAVGEGVQL